MQKLKICHLDLNQKTLLIRADLNVPLKPDGSILSTERIQASLPTIILALKQKTKIILLSHLGRIKTSQDKNRYSLKQVATEIQRQLERVLGKKIVVKFSPHTSGPLLKEEVKKLEFGEILLLENTRFEDLNDKAESKNNQNLAKEWAGLGDVFVNDAFGTLHRSHASNYGIAKFSKISCLGLLVEHEIRQLTQLLESPKSPFVAIVGGAKVVDKIGILKNLLKKVDKLLIGGGMAYTFMKVLGKEVGHSLVDKNALEEAKLIIEEYQEKIVLPLDFTCATGTDAKEFTILDSIPPHLESLDIGPKTVEVFKKHILGAKTVFWNGPLGFYENPLFAKATKEVAKALAQNPDAFCVVGGGDSAAAASEFREKISHISTGGGAALEFLEGKAFESLEIISNQKEEVATDCQKEWYNVSSFVDKNLKIPLNTVEKMQENNKKPETASKTQSTQTQAVNQQNTQTATVKPAAPKPVTPPTKPQTQEAPVQKTTQTTPTPKPAAETKAAEVAKKPEVVSPKVAEKVAEKVVEKVAEKVVETPVTKPVEKVEEKPVAKPTAKPATPVAEKVTKAPTPTVEKDTKTSKPTKPAKATKAAATKVAKTAKPTKATKATKAAKATKATKVAKTTKTTETKAPTVELPKKEAAPKTVAETQVPKSTSPKPTESSQPQPKKSFFASLFSFFKRK